MAKQNFEKAFALMIQHEGGFVNHPKDRGKATNLGVTIKTLSDWLGRPATIQEVKALTIEKVKPIYKKNYWDAVRCDDLPIGIDYALFDFAVNSGPGVAARKLQGSIGVPADGIVGRVTLNAIWTADQAWLIDQYMDDRLHFVKQLDTWSTFGKGWSRRIAGVRKAALAMAKANPKPFKPNFDIAAPAPVSEPWRPDLEPIDITAPVPANGRPVTVLAILAVLAIVSIGAVAWMLF